MRSSLVGTRASGAGEPYTQEANVTDAAMVRLNCRTQDTLESWDFPRRWLKGRGTKQGRCWNIPCPATDPLGCQDVREADGPYIPPDEFRAWSATSRGPKGTYGSTTLATRATPEPVVSFRKDRSADDQ